MKSSYSFYWYWNVTKKKTSCGIDLESEYKPIQVLAFAIKMKHQDFFGIGIEDLWSRRTLLDRHEKVFILPWSEHGFNKFLLKHIPSILLLVVFPFTNLLGLCSNPDLPGSPLLWFIIHDLIKSETFILGTLGTLSRNNIVSSRCSLIFIFFLLITVTVKNWLSVTAMYIYL